ncbi:MipA/OmpV family protein [Thalassomonas sp. M1454]|uniref:MipA/OmpV family protein n=1 Tax=Thalassomonas sp. M1454 TaxID=2594477 RepID=UPI00117D322C|nr:MipA/OmpV family protein [Thalassomonas sp. M1454]TRX54464.1 MipA/OmpV family protein [Thalassomonas sp. M1454]
MSLTVQTVNSIKPTVLLISLWFLSCAITFSVYADEMDVDDQIIGKPVWEAGIFTAAFNGPIYPAASDTQNKFLPVPFVIYRGERVRVGDGSFVKAMAVEKERFKLDVSLGAAFNADSEKSKIREGMPDLDFLFEIGPQASFLLDDNDSSNTWLNLQVRSVFTTDFSEVDHKGYLFQPEVAFKGKGVITDDSDFGFSIAPIWATKKTHDYFYSVDQQYVNEDREFYQAHSGYLGTKISIFNRFLLRKNLSIFFASQIGVWSGAKNEDSPLFQQDVTYTFAIGVKWTLYESNQLVQ